MNRGYFIKCIGVIVSSLPLYSWTYSNIGMSTDKEIRNHVMGIVDMLERDIPYWNNWIFDLSGAEGDRVLRALKNTQSLGQTHKMVSSKYDGIIEYRWEELPMGESGMFSACFLQKIKTHK